MRWHKKLIISVPLLIVPLLLPGCTGKMNVTIKEGARFPVGSKIFFSPVGRDPLQLEVRIVNHLLASGYEWTSWDHSADFYLTYGHAGGVTPLYPGGLRPTTVTGLIIIIDDKYGNMIAHGSMSSGSMNVESALAAFFRELKKYQ